MHNPHPYDLWLEPVLDRHLGRVNAPPELWGRVRNAAAQPAKKSANVRLRLLTAAALAAAALWGFLPRRTVTEFRSDTATEIRAWVKMRTGLDVPLPNRPSPAVQLTGACEVGRDTPAIEVAVSYRVRGHPASLHVSKLNVAPDAPPEGGKHRFLKCESVGGERVSSWTMRGQLYTLAYAAPGESRDECLLCHVE